MAIYDDCSVHRTSNEISKTEDKYNLENIVTYFLHYPDMTARMHVTK
jgi:hypothetical protein